MKSLRCLLWQRVVSRAGDGGPTVSPAEHVAGKEGKWFSFYTAPRDRCDRYGRADPTATATTARPRRSEGVRERGRVCEGGCEAPDTSVARVNMNISMEACREECLKECSCSGYAAANVSGSGSGCLSWHGDLVDTRVFPEGGQDLYVRVDAITLAENQKQSKGFLAKKGMMAVLVVGLP
ncbi:Receptor-like serine/threonine-protein kinase SD1-8 [Vitis vinifera]|uniref:Receptor-like serine/threonine-protein kinase SD1-8 n=1 Tax=Vitis vinifera TaxID=29760 RepID=A0A438HPG9_VITVI|nr:Receptor-like serine/threonine-protein kinase SD1-8 [Vitis vinifera]